MYDILNVCNWRSEGIKLSPAAGLTRTQRKRL